MNSKNILLTNTLWVYGSKLSTQLLGLITTILIVRTLTVQDFGSYGFLLNAYVIFSIFSISSIVTVFNRYIPETTSYNSFSNLKWIITQGSAFFLLVSVLFISGLIIWGNLIGRSFNIVDLQQYLLELCLYLIFLGSKSLVNSILRAFLLHRYVASLEIACALLRLVGYLVLANSLSVGVLLMIETILSILFIIPGIVHIAREFRVLKNTPEATQPTNFQRRVIRFGSFSFFNELGAGLIGKASDFYIIAAFSNPLTLAFYSFSLRIHTIIYNLIPLEEFISVLRPLLIKKFGGEDQDNRRINQIFNLLVKILLPLYTIPIILFLIFGKPLIILVFDPRYLDAYLLIVIILLGNINTALFHPLNVLVQLKERPDINLYSKVVSLISIAGAIIAMKFFGVVALAIVSVTCETIKNLFILLMFKKTAGVKYVWGEYRPMLLLFLIFLFLGIPFTLIPITNTLTLAGSIGIYLSLAALLAFRFKPITESDAQLIGTVLNSSVKIKRARNSAFAFVAKLKLLMN